MSHFTVMVIGENPEEQLEPYSENLEVPEYVSDEISDEEKQKFADFYCELSGKDYCPVKTQEEADANKLLTFEQLYEKYGNDWNGSSWKPNPVSGVWEERSTYNPDSKWDWYSLGGRWTGYFKIKKGAKGKTGSPGLMTESAKKGYADQLLLKDIDIDGMVADACNKGIETYKKAQELINGEPFKTWEEAREMFPDDIDKARDFYNTQPPVERFRKSKDFGFFDSPDEYRGLLSDFVTRQGNSAISTFAVLKNGTWYEKGEMGWWGMVSDEKDQDEWNAKVAELLKGLPEDTLISLYDCHI